MKFRSSAAFRILAAFIVGGLFLAGAGYLAISGGRAYFDSGTAIERLHAADRIDATLRALVNTAELRASEYVMTGNSEALDGYRRASGAIDNAVGNLRTALGWFADAQPALDRLTGVIPARRAQLDAYVASRRADEPADPQIFDGAARRNVEAAFDNLDAQIASQLNASSAQRRDSVGAMQRGIWLAVAVMIMLFSAAYTIVLGELRERRRLSRRLRCAATHDALTGLPNRRFFGEWTGYAIANARREGAHVGVVFIAVDGPLDVYKHNGRAAFNTLLVEIARRFRETAREGDLIGRVGPAQFAVAAPNVSSAPEFTHLAQRLRDALTDPARSPLAEVPIGASIGIALFPDEADDTAGVMAAAEAAMYAAKRAGSNRVAFNTVAEVA
ncbi:MAG TPA: diguanylate cyclase [Casimicrobiaceae bacterium]|nr:diguanylate cyclase [Casimicrobiaceae bacterium]